HVVALARGAAGPGARVIDAYCGIGLHARRLAREGATVTGIELDPDALRDARRAAPPGTEFLEGRSEEHTSELQSRENLVCRLLSLAGTSTVSLHDALPICTSWRSPAARPAPGRASSTPTAASASTPAASPARARR